MNTIIHYLNEMLADISELSVAISLILVAIAVLPLLALIFKPRKKAARGLLWALLASIVLCGIIAFVKPTFGCFAVAFSIPLYVFDLWMLKEYTSKKLTVRTLVYGAICTALSFVLSYITLFRMPQGGSITLVSMLPIIVYSYAFGTVPGFIVGTAYGLLQLIQSPYVIHPVQLIMDYPLPFALMGLSGIIRTRKIHIDLIAGTVLAAVARYACHVLSGVIFFASYAGNQNVWIYSAGYNSFVFLETFICLVVLMIPSFTKMVAKLRARR